MSWPLTRAQSISALGASAIIVLGWVGSLVADVKNKADRVPVLDNRTEMMYTEIQTLRQQQTELLIVLYGALGDLKRAAELKVELKDMKAEAADRQAAKEEK